MSKSPTQEERARKPRRKLTAAERKEIRKIMEKARGDGKPHSAQDTLPFRQIYPDGLCKLDDNTWSRCIEFEDVNYQLALPDDQTAIFEALCDLYNSHDSSIGMEISLPCRHMNKEDFVKRIEIATLLARNPQVAIFDEPEAGIDLWSFSMLVETFKKMQKDSKGTVIIISHQERIMALADEVVVIADGKISRHGSKEEVLPDLMKEFSPSCCAKR